MNKITSFLDATFAYGKNDTHTRKLRAMDGTGRIGMQMTGHGRILSANQNDQKLFCPINQTTHCFFTGDDRVNQHVMMMSLQTMFERFHNKIADALCKTNPHWDADKIFHESKRILVAIYQHLIYTEYLPLLLGSENMIYNDLPVDGVSRYNDMTNPFIMAEFNTAAFRLHSMVPTKISRFYGKAMMRNTYSYTEPIHLGTWPTIVAGSWDVPSEKNDGFITTDVTENLNRPPGADFGFDLASINIQRGRDHGLPPYVQVVEKCSNYKIKYFSDLEKLMIPRNIKLIESLYGGVKYIDLWVGIILEKHIKGGLVGPTAACVISKQFKSLKFGDSFFFTHENGRYPFTKDQLDYIRKYTVARFLCDTMDYPHVRQCPFELPSARNPIKKCDKFPFMDLKAWKE